MSRSQQAELLWSGNAVPISARFNDPYFSLENGLAESRHVFLAGNDLPNRFRAGFQIAELGFGTGLNLLAAHLSWLETGLSGSLAYTGFEAFPMTPGEMERALAAFPETHLVADPLLDAWKSGKTRFSAPGLKVEIILGDARETLPRWRNRADAWFLDGFAPARNPEMWEPELLAEVARHTGPNGTFATFSAAGSVRRALEMAGFKVSRIQGFGGKRHMAKGSIHNDSADA